MPSPPAIETSSPPRKRLKFEDNAIPVLVGREKVSFVVHKQLICEKSGLFQQTLHGDSETTTNNQVTLINIDPRNFSNFLQWLYCQSLPDNLMIQDQETGHPCFSWTFATNLYILAHSLRSSAFGNAIVDCIRGRLNERFLMPMPNAKEITNISAQTPADCGFHRLIVLMHTTMARAGGVLNTEIGARAWIRDVPAEFAQDLVVKLLQEGWGWIQGFWEQGKVVEWIKDKEEGCLMEKGLDSGELTH